jgi:hypothetical protein
LPYEGERIRVYPNPRPAAERLTAQLDQKSGSTPLPSIGHASAGLGLSHNLCDNMVRSFFQSLANLEASHKFDRRRMTPEQLGYRDIGVLDEGLP